MPVSGISSALEVNGVQILLKPQYFNSLSCFKFYSSYALVSGEQAVLNYLNLRAYMHLFATRKLRRLTNVLSSWQFFNVSSISTLFYDQDWECLCGMWSVSCDGGRRRHFSFQSSRLHTSFTLPMLLLHTSFTLVSSCRYIRFTLVSHSQLLHLMLDLVRRSYETRWLSRLKVPRCLSVWEQSAVKIAIYILLKGRLLLLRAVTEWVLQSAWGGRL